MFLHGTKCSGTEQNVLVRVPNVLACNIPPPPPQKTIHYSVKKYSFTIPKRSYFKISYIMLWNTSGTQLCHLYSLSTPVLYTILGIFCKFGSWIFSYLETIEGKLYGGKDEIYINLYNPIIIPPTTILKGKYLWSV